MGWYPPYRDVQGQLAELERELQAAKAGMQEAQQQVTRARSEEADARGVSTAAPLSLTD
jgi:septation ring formation regulator EzrA